MEFSLRRPCRGCPFRVGGEGAVRFLGESRAREISDALLSGLTFSCHETVDYSREEYEESLHIPSSTEQHCAGAMILLERINRPNQMMRWMERLYFYDRTKLDMGADVFDSFDDFVTAQSEGGR